MTHSVHVKGFDSFDMSSYHEGGTEMIAALRAGGINGACQPSHVAILSDIGANSGGGGLPVIGGYLTFQGIHAKGNCKGSPVEDVLPVEFFPFDDRCERPQGVTTAIVKADHPVLGSLSDWPQFLGFNRATARPEAVGLARFGDHPFIAARDVGAVFPSDCGPHWGPPPFLGWSGYPTFWTNLVGWLAEGQS